MQDIIKRLRADAREWMVSADRAPSDELKEKFMARAQLAQDAIETIEDLRQVVLRLKRLED